MSPRPSMASGSVPSSPAMLVSSSCSRSVPTVPTDTPASNTALEPSSPSGQDHKRRRIQLGSWIRGRPHLSSRQGRSHTSRESNPARRPQCSAEHKPGPAHQPRPELEAAHRRSASSVADTRRGRNPTPSNRAIRPSRWLPSVRGDQLSTTGVHAGHCHHATSSHQPRPCDGRGVRSEHRRVKPDDHAHLVERPKL